MKDFLLDETYDLASFINNDVVINESGQQDIELLLKANKGAFKNEPLVGAGIDMFINASMNINEIRHIIQSSLSADGITLNNVFYSKDNQLVIDASR